MINQPHPYEKIVYLLQGGGALGAYQVGICQKLLENNFAPDWVIGTSIGAFNSAIIAGNHPADRVLKLKEFWDTITLPLPQHLASIHNDQLKKWESYCCSLGILNFGVPGFFTPKYIEPWLNVPSTPDKISFYDTSVLKSTLEKVVNFDIINQQHTRISLNAVDVESGELNCFDNTQQEIDVRHVMASGALPPGFPAVNIDGKLYWDGGINSNTPLLNILQEEKLSNEILCFMIDLFSNQAVMPQTMPEVMNRKKDLEYADRYQQIVTYFCNTHRLRHSLRKILAYNKLNNISCPADNHLDLGDPRSLNIIRFLYRDQSYDTWSKDFEFSRSAIAQHWNAGLRDAEKALDSRCWFNVVPDEDSGLSMHEF